MAIEADIAPGLIHHNFKNKEDMISSLLSVLIKGFRERTREYRDSPDKLVNYGDAALKLDEKADLISARCWVGIFAEAVRNPTLFRQMQRLIDAEVSTIQRYSGGKLSTREASSLLAYVVGSLVLGSFAPKRTAGFAAKGFRQLVRAMNTTD